MKMCVSGGHSRWLFSKEIPFRLLRNKPHHLMSALASWFSLIQSFKLGREQGRSINLLRNILPGLTTLQACDNSPKRDSNNCISLLLADFLHCKKCAPYPVTASFLHLEASSASVLCQTPLPGK